MNLTKFLSSFLCLISSYFVYNQSPFGLVGLLLGVILFNCDRSPARQTYINSPIPSVPNENKVILNNNHPVFIDPVGLNKEPANVNENFYDVEMRVESIAGIKSGWEIKFADKNDFVTRFVDNLERTVVVGVVGNYNKGKSFFLKKLSNYKIEHSYYTHTRGLSVKFQQNIKKKLTLLDSAGEETPINLNGKKDSDILFLNKDRALLQTFSQGYIIKNSQILFVVVGQLTKSEQILINKLRNMCRGKKDLFVIHNLVHFKERSNVESYIKNELKMNLPEVIPDDYNDMDNSEKYKDKNTMFLQEKNNKVLHLFIAKDNTPAGDYYSSTFEYIKKYIETQGAICFNPVDQLQEHLVESINMFEGNYSKFKKENITISPVEGEQNLDKMSILGFDDNVQLKDCVTYSDGRYGLVSASINPGFTVVTDKEQSPEMLEVIIDIPDLDGETDFNLVNNPDGTDSLVIFGKKKTKVFDKENGKREDSRQDGSFEIMIKLERNWVLASLFKTIYENGVLHLVYEIQDKTGRIKNKSKMTNKQS